MSARGFVTFGTACQSPAAARNAARTDGSAVRYSAADSVSPLTEKVQRQEGMMPEWLGGAGLGSGLGLLPADHWKAQLVRVACWHLRVVEYIREKALIAELDAFDLDEVIAYLQNCYHLRDWLEASRPALNSQLDAFFQEHFELSACRDVFNGFKHKSLKRPSHDPDFNLHRSTTISSKRRSPAGVLCGIESDSPMETASESSTCSSSMNTCLDLWREFLEREVEVSTRA